MKYNYSLKLSPITHCSVSGGVVLLEGQAKAAVPTEPVLQA